MASLARAFTKRVKRSASDAHLSPSRNASVRIARPTIDRSMISLPTELLSTTNVQVLTAPNIHNISRSSSGSSVAGSDSEFSTIDRGFLDPSSDTSSIEDSAPATPVTPTGAGLDSFFNAKKLDDVTPALAEPFLLEAPVLPKRAPSHSKKAHVELSRKLSMNRLTPPPSAITKPVARDNVEHFITATDSTHPFMRELAQVNEVAEEFGATRALLDEEERDLYHRGFCKFTAEDYMDEIAGLSGGIFDNRLGPLANPWM